MFLGAEIGYDFPNYATHLRVLALIFLRLIKTINAPLLFGTLVVGIAGHSNLKQVGRLGLRSIIFFEVITTIAIFLGLGAINLSKAGVGVPARRLPQRQTRRASSKLNAEDTILHVFPENIAKAVADNAVLQVVVFSLIFAIALAMISEEKRPDAEALRPCRNDVQVHQHRDVYGTAGRGSRDGLHCGTWRVCHSWQPAEASVERCMRRWPCSSSACCCRLRCCQVPLKRFIQAVAEPVTIAFATSGSGSGAA